MPNNTLYPTTYRNGATAIPPNRRVFESGGLLRLASDTELENGIVDRHIRANDNAAVYTFSTGDVVILEAAGAISAEAAVFRATSGRVSATGSSRIGRAQTAALAAGDYLCVVIEPGSGGGTGSSDNRKEGVHGTTLTLSGSDLVWQLNAHSKDNVLFDLGGGAGNVNVNLTITGTVRPGEYTLYVTNVGTKQLVWAATVWSGEPPQPIPGIQTGFKIEVLPDGSIKGTGYTS
jgi:hypothetical protein